MAAWRAERVAWASALLQGLGGYLPLPLAGEGRGVQTGKIGNNLDREHRLHKLSYEQGGFAHALDRDLCNGFKDAVDS